MSNLYAARQFHRDYYESHVWNGPTHWLGVPFIKPPTDMWAVQQIITECCPTIIVECGTAYGGSGLFYACVMDMLGGEGHVHTIDIPNSLCWNSEYGYMSFRPEHPRLSYICDDSTNPELPTRLGLGGPDKSVMVILDSDHHKDHVLKELELWGPLVTIDQYLIVEDTRLDQKDWLGSEAAAHDYYGPSYALKEWLPKQNKFLVDRSVQPALTFSPGGYLKAVK